MREKIRSAFFEYGWLLPLLTPAAQVGGRALINILMLVYLVWALLAVPGSRMRLERPARTALLLYGALLLAYLISVPGALDVDKALHEWVKFALHSLTFYFTLIVLTHRADALERLMVGLGVAGLLLLTALLAVLPWQIAKPGFLPTANMIEDNLPFLAPFVLYWAWIRLPARARLPAMAGLFAAIAAYVVFSQGRAALAGLLVALFVAVFFVVRTRHGIMLLLGGMALSVALAMSSANFFRGQEESDRILTQQHQAQQRQEPEAAWVETLDRFTSFRTQLWRQALRNPPPSQLRGVGMGNAGLAGEVTTIQGAAHFGHLHNFLFDAWYETGLLGLGALLAFVAYPLVRGLRLVRTGIGPSVHAGLFLASAAALLTAGLLSFSYASRQFSVYLPMLLAALWFLSISRKSSA